MLWPCFPGPTGLVSSPLEARQRGCGGTGGHEGSCTCSFLQLLDWSASQAAGQEGHHLQANVGISEGRRPADITCSMTSGACGIMGSESYMWVVAQAGWCRQCVLLQVACRAGHNRINQQAGLFW